ncbi:hypothetical protein Q3G72_020228 [Acer saccharum]|nr:hypothetical protein Q3G72_020228 [Acer saccharum]
MASIVFCHRDANSVAVSLAKRGAAGSDQVGNTGCSTPKRYIGIWYHRTPDAVVANRDAPIFDTSGNLTIDPTDGNLKNFHTGGNPIAKTSVQGASNNTSATFLETGNFVLHETNPDGSIGRI